VLNPGSKLGENKIFLQIAGVFDYVLKIKKIRQKRSRLIAKMISYTKEFHALLVKKLHSCNEFQGFMEKPWGKKRCFSVNHWSCGVT